MHDSFLKILGKKIKELRKLRGYTQQRVADLADTTHVTVGRIEKGAQPPGVDLLLRIGEALDTPAWEIMEYANLGGAPARTGAAYSPRVKALADQLERLSPKSLEMVEVMVESFVIAGEVRAAKSKKPKGETG